jgi:hypothetical protein
MCFIVVVLDAKEGRMDFSELNWLAIAIATLANMLLAYFWFHSTFSTKWNMAIQKAGNQVLDWRQIFWFFPYSITSAIAFSLALSLSENTIESIMFWWTFSMSVIIFGNRAIYDLAGRKRIIYVFESMFYAVGITMTMFIIVIAF